MEKDSSEIAKLTERIAKDPKSKLFVPLAEEYKKIGDIEMAINVLQDGLKNNPGYITARSFLGRLLLENGDFSGAQKELEEVIKTVPDNLLAHRKLAELFILQGKTSEALQRYRTALSLNPADKDVIALVKDIEAGTDVSGRVPKPKALGAAAQVRKADAPSPAPPAAKPAAPAVPKPTAAAPQKQVSAAAPVSAPAPKPAVAPAPAAGAPTAAPAPAPAPKTVVTVPSAPAAPPAAPVTEAIEEIIEIEATEPPASVMAAPAARKAPKQEEAPAKVTGAASFDLAEPVIEEAPAAIEEAPISWEAAVAPVEERPAPAPQESGNDDINTNTLAELYITQGFYEKAIEIYEGMLAEKPGNRALEQKLAKLREMSGVVPQAAGTEFTVPASVQDQAEAPPRPAVVERTLKDAGLQPAIELPTVKEQPPLAGRAAPDAEKPVVPAATGGAAGATARRKETIDRLESWLRNIKKEKP